MLNIAFAQIIRLLISLNHSRLKTNEQKILGKIRREETCWRVVVNLTIYILILENQLPE